MSNKSPIFPIPEPQHFTDYGCDPQIDYFQFLEEARKHRRETTRSVDSLLSKLQKPISKDESNRKTSKAKKKRWWRNALFFFKWKRLHVPNEHLDDYKNRARIRAIRAPISGPLYTTESRGGSKTIHRTTRRPSSGPLAGTLTPTRNGNVEIPYFSLRELNVEGQQRMSTPFMPIYLVT